MTTSYNNTGGTTIHNFSTARNLSKLMEAQDVASSAIMEEDDKSTSSGGTVEKGSTDAKSLVSGGSTANDSSSGGGYRGLTPDETKAVRRLRRIVMGTLLCLTIAISVLVWYQLDKAENDEFLEAFETEGNKLVSGFRDDSFQKMQVLDTLSTALTSYALAANRTWPFVLVENSHDFFSPFLSSANAASIKILPIVQGRERLAWEQFTIENSQWLEEDLSRGISSEKPTNRKLQEETDEEQEVPEEEVISPYIKNYVGVDTSPHQWMPWWQYAPVIENKYFLNFNQLADEQFYREVQSVLAGKAVISKTMTFEPGLDFQSTRDFTFTRELLSAGGFGNYEEGEPVSYIHYPVFQDLTNTTSRPVAILSATVYWRTFFQNILPESSRGIVCVVENDEQAFTYYIDGKDAIYGGMSDTHDSQYDKLKISATYKAFELETDSVRYVGVPVDDQLQIGGYRIHVYPSQQYQDDYSTGDPWIYAGAVAALMSFAISVFILYDWFVERRQRKISSVAKRSDAIVTSLFPAKIREQLYHQEDAKENTAAAAADKRKNNPLIPKVPRNSRKSTFHSGDGITDEYGEDPTKHPMEQGTEDEYNPHDSNPIADFFPSTTVLFMDVAGFTAWSSSREPRQVFILLETLYHAFDVIARKRKVFKVETIGDCYVAVCGLPDLCETHALNMAKFARDCVARMNSVLHHLEPKLGPDTCELQVRVGMHSGPCTAGVLRGDRARFQLFGDTVNTAARMESTGVAGRIQVSRETAELITAHGMHRWITKREDTVVAKGKGEMTTYWVATVSSRRAPSAASFSANETISSTSSSEMMGAALEGDINRDSHKAQRLVGYCSDLLIDLIMDIHDKRQKQGNGPRYLKTGTARIQRIEEETKVADSCIQELVEVIELPGPKEATEKRSFRGEVFDPKVPSQVRKFCGFVAKSYGSNPFHNFEHCCHVVQSSMKLLSRVIVLDEGSNSNSSSHDSTLGINSDPLTQFAVIFVAMIHDIDHKGVPNSRLAEECPDLVDRYTKQALAEQHSVNVAWTELMKPDYAELRRAIYETPEELKRFRQLVVQNLLATDIFDPELKAIREKRWSNAFDKRTSSKEESLTVEANRKATIVLEHIIQASDVSHTMQHFHVYLKWNGKLFAEMYKAYHEGRSSKNPTEGWYKGELWFFDNYVIPLAKKLKECGVFGVSGDEYLTYAVENRKKWERQGQMIVQSNLKKIIHNLENSE